MENVTYQQIKLDLIEEITAAFDGVSRDGGVSLSESWVIDNYGSEEMRAEARKQDTDTKWQDVPDEDICEGYQCLTFLDTIGFRYYIPAYIVWFLRYIDNQDPKFDSDTYPWLIYALGAIKNHEDSYLERFQSFSLEQSRAIAHFLVFDANRNDVIAMEMKCGYPDRLDDESFSRNDIEKIVEEARLFRQEHYLPQNDARQALEKYWKKFL